MSFSRVQSCFDYMSEASSGAKYFFQVCIDLSGRVGVRNIRTPYGRITDSQTSLPNEVVDDICAAKLQVEDLVSQTSVFNGFVSFVGESSKTVSFTTVFASPAYRVYLDIPDFVAWKITSKTVSGFVIELGSEFTGDIGFDVFV